MAAVEVIQRRVVAHDLQNCLSIINSNAELVLDNANNQKLHVQCAKNIRTATKRAGSIIQNSLQDLHGPYNRMTEVNLIALLDESISLLAHQIDLKKITIKKKFQPDLPRILGSPAALHQVFINLINNAITAMPHGGTLTVTASASGTEHVQIQFQDTGCGIPPSLLSRIFDPFFTTDLSGKGTGLGLFISRGIIHQHHNGTIEVASKVGIGSTFTIQLPCRISATEQVAERH